MKLASHLHRTVKEAKLTVSLDEFYRWQAFYELEPWGRKAETLQLATGFARAASVMGAKYRAEDFITPDPEWLTESEYDDDDPLGWNSRERNRKP